MGNDARAIFFNYLRKRNEIVRETKRYPNVDTSHLNTKMTNFNFFKIFQNHLENHVKAIVKTFEKKTKKIMRET